jgi:uncharacterized membrane protein YbhN (UPF0104 family)
MLLARASVVSAIIGTSIGLVLVAVLITWVGLDAVLANVHGVDPFYLAIYVGLAVSTYLLRAFRFRLLLGGGGSVSKLYGVVSLHTLMLNLLPFSAGDLSYPVLLKRYGVSRQLLDGLPSLVLVRVQDLAITGALLLVGLVWIGRASIVLGPAEPLRPQVILAILTVVAAIGFLAQGLMPSPLRRRLQAALRTIWATARDLDLRAWIGTLLVGALGRLVSIVGVFYLFVAVGIPLPLITVLLINTVYTFLPFLPVNVLAGVGITEAYLVACFVASGVDRSLATAASFQIHGLQVLIAALLAATGFIQLQYLVAREPRSVSAVTHPAGVAHERDL